MAVDVELAALRERIRLLEEENRSLRQDKNMMGVEGSIPSGLFTLELMAPDLDDTLVAAYVSDMESHEILFASNTVKKLSGSCVGQKCYKALQMHDEPCPFCTNQALRDNPEKAIVWEFYNTKNDRWYRCIDRLIHGAGGRPLRYEIAIDISDLREAQAELERFRAALDASAEGIFLLDNETGRYMDVNNGACELLGYTREELLCMGPCDVNRSLGEEQCRNLIQHVSVSTDVMVMEEHYHRKDGVIIPVEVNVHSLTNNEGRAISVIVARDISDRLKGQRAMEVRYLYEHLLASCARELLSQQCTDATMSRVLETLRQGAGACRAYIFENHHDQQGRLRFSQRLESVAPGVRPEIDNTALQNVLYEQNAPSWLGQLGAGISIMGLVRDMAEPERSVLLAQGIRSILVLPIMAQGHWYGYIGFDDTLAEREWLNSDILFLKTASEILGAALERKRAEAELSSSQQRAEEASKAKSMFLANMSHEIRTPLNAIIGLTELTLQEQLTASVQDNLRGVLGSAQSLLSVINDLLDLSQVESGRLNIKTVPFSPDRLVRGIVRVLARDADRKGLDLDLYVDPAVPQTVYGDSGRVRQILLNFVGNAIKFTDEGGVNIYLKLSRSEQVGTSRERVVLTFTVKDTGIGIPAEKQSSVFESFAHEVESPARRFGGAGLGLAVSRRLVEMMGGRLGLESVFGAGSSFWCELPFALEADMAGTGVLPLSSRKVVPASDAIPVRRPSGHKKPATPDSRPDVEPLRVLVVDADELCRRSMVAALRNRGHIPTGAADVRRAHEALAHSRFDIMVLDVVTTGEAASGEKSGGSLIVAAPALPVVYLLPDCTDEEYQLQRPDVESFLAKPVRLKELCELAESVVMGGVDARRRDVSSLMPEYEPVLQPDAVLITMAETRMRLYRQLPSLRESLWSSMDRGNRVELISLVHHLLHEIEGLGACRVTALATRLEDRLRNSSPEDAHPVFLLLADALNQLEHDLVKIS